MKYEMRRAKQRLSPEESLDILNKGSSGVLALWDGEEPYAVPLSYVYHGGKLYFHCARAGRKLESIKVCPRASFCVVAADDVIPEKYTTAYRSVIVSGPLRILTDEAEMVPALHLLAEKYNPGHSEDAEKEISAGLSHMLMLELRADEISGKQGKELLNQ
ncbi:MAG: pyridoxamine 5'-phosphate oxidase family protein [Clostridiales bacterium]|nr:pyridoxamine 5'-phosphate oxidase family protein [Clostridiales bacterium]